MTTVFTDTVGNIFRFPVFKGEPYRFCQVISTADFARGVVDDYIFTFHEFHYFI